MTQREESENRTGNLCDYPDDKFVRNTLISPDLTEKSPDETIHDLRIYLKELEIDNEKLKRAYLDLESSRDQFLDLYDLSPMGYLSLTREGLIAEVNLTGAMMLGVFRRDLVHDHFMDFIAPEDHESWEGFFRNALKKGEKQICELVIRRKDGTEFSAWIEGISSKMSNGTVHILIVISDITEHKQAVEALRESKEKYHSLSTIMRLMCDNVPDMIWAKNLEKRYIFANKAICSGLLNATDTDEPIGKNDLFFAGRERSRYPDNPKWHTFGEICRDTDQMTMDAGEPQQYDEYGNVRGKFLFLDVRKAPFIDDNGKMIGTVGSARDVTISKQLEEALRVSEERYRDLITTTADFVWETDHESRFIYVSPQVEGVLGYSPDELKGRTPFEFLEPVSVSPNKEVFLTAKTEHRTIISYDSCWRHKNGSCVVMETRAKPVISPDGTITGFRGIDRDVTERKQTEAALRESEERFRTVLQQVPSVAVQGYGMDGTTQYWNKASEILYGYTEQEAVGRNLVDLIIPPEMKDDVRQAIAYMAETGQPIPASELLLMRKDGSRVTVFSSHAIINRGTGGLELFCIDVDLSERQHVEESLHEANQKLRFLTGLTRHDIFNQLAAVHQFHALAMDEQDMAAKNRYISYARQASDRIESIIRFTREYETFGTVSSGWQGISGIIDSAQQEVSLGRCVVENEIPPGLEVYADPIIRKVFTSLMENAIRHGGGVKKIRFSHALQDDFRIIIVEDDGVGVPAEEKECIFDHGYGKHTGIGLFLSKEILSITGLSIRENGVEGKGARFEIMVPAGKHRETR